MMKNVLEYELVVQSKDGAMKYSITVANLQPSAFKQNWGRFLIWGLVLIALGALAISAATLTTIISVFFLGLLILTSGIVIMIDTFSFWWSKWYGFSLHLLMGVLSSAVGILFITNPLSASIPLTLLLGTLFILTGTIRIAYSSSLRSPKWGWVFISGMVSLLLGTLIMSHWPASSLYIIGLFVGVDLLFFGWAYVMAALAARSLTQ